MSSLPAGRSLPRHHPDYGRGQVSLDAHDPVMEEACAWLADAAEHAVGSLPMLPGGAQEALRLSFDPAASFNQIAGVIEPDPVLAAVALQKANGFLFSRRCASLSDALVRLGLQGVREVILTAGALRVLRTPVDPELGQWLRRRAEAAAHAASVVELVRGSHRAEAYTAGLLHDIGWVYAYGIIGAHRESARPALFSDFRRARAAVRRCHTALGSRVVTRWGLPAAVADAVSAHHATDPRAGGIAAATVRAALATLDALGVAPEGPAFELSALAELGLSSDAIAAVPTAVFGALRRHGLVQDRRASKARRGPGAERRALRYLGAS